MAKLQISSNLICETKRRHHNDNLDNAMNYSVTITSLFSWRRNLPIIMKITNNAKPYEIIVKSEKGSLNKKEIAMALTTSKRGMERVMGRRHALFLRSSDTKPHICFPLKMEQVTEKSKLCTGGSPLRLPLLLSQLCLKHLFHKPNYYYSFITQWN